jgi:hypothetical protein
MADLSRKYVWLLAELGAAVDAEKGDAVTEPLVARLDALWARMTDAQRDESRRQSRIPIAGIEYVDGDADDE